MTVYLRIKEAKTKHYKTEEVESSILLKNKMKPPLSRLKGPGRGFIKSIIVMFPNLSK